MSTARAVRGRGLADSTWLTGVEVVTLQWVQLGHLAEAGVKQQVLLVGICTVTTTVDQLFPVLKMDKRLHTTLMDTLIQRLQSHH